jgi:hypothetical protein
MVCIGRSKLICRYRNKTPCARLVRSCRWSWRSPFLGHPSPWSVRYYEPLTLIPIRGAQLIEKIGECTLLPTIKIHSQMSLPRLCILLPRRIPMGNTNFHEFPKSFKVGSSAGHLAQSLQVILHS